MATATRQPAGDRDRAVPIDDLLTDLLHSTASENDPIVAWRRSLDTDWVLFRTRAGVHFGLRRPACFLVLDPREAAFREDFYVRYRAAVAQVAANLPADPAAHGRGGSPTVATEPPS